MPSEITNLLKFSTKNLSQSKLRHRRRLQSASLKLNRNQAANCDNMDSLQRQGKSSKFNQFVAESGCAPFGQSGKGLKSANIFQTSKRFHRGAETMDTFVNSAQKGLPVKSNSFKMSGSSYNKMVRRSVDDGTMSSTVSGLTST